MTKSSKVACSFVEKDGAYEINFDYEDNQGLKISRDVAGNDPAEMLNTLRQDITKDVLQQRKLKQAKENDKSDKKVEEKENIAALKQTIEKLKEQNLSLKTDLQILQQRADDAVNQLMEIKKKQESEEDELISLFKSLGFKPSRWF